MTVLPTQVAIRRNTASAAKHAPAALEVLGQDLFIRSIALERKRTERTNIPFLLLLLEAENDPGLGTMEESLAVIASSLSVSIRETDVIGWYKERTAVGVMFTGLQIKDKNLIASLILNRVNAILRSDSLLDQVSNLKMSFYFFPDDWENLESGRPLATALYPDLLTPDRSCEFALKIKRAIDVAGSVCLLICLSPLFVAVALAVKCTSKGPVLFKQERIGQHGKRFTFLKFRSMMWENDHSAHREFVTKFISDQAEHQSLSPDCEGIYKLTKDKRVTVVGKFLRRSSLDELPQLLNVLRGEMSLVGPRPPIPYEMAVYKIWHRNRVLRVRPGITGLWQVTGRSRVKFDEMVRLDLRYASTWTPWLDIKILLSTPSVVVRGTGAV
jgi:lipopolysaccharide/colanic/teichoic acid biosynthesis glycosyltransferase